MATDKIEEAFAAEVRFAMSALMQVEGERRSGNDSRVRWLLSQVRIALEIAESYVQLTGSATMREQLEALKSRLREAENFAK